MYCSQLIRISRTSLCPVVLNPVSSRAYTATPPPTGQPAPNPKVKRADNTFMYTTFGLLAAAGAYYYFRNTDEVQGLKDKEDAAQTWADAKQQGKAKLIDSKEKLDSTVERETETRGRLGGLAADLEAKYDSVRDSAKESLARARGSTENLYDEARLLTEQKAANAREGAQKKIDQAKNGWFGWFNWGKLKADGIESEADRLKGKGESVKERAEKRT